MGHILSCTDILDSDEEEACSVTSEHHEQDRLDCESSCLKTQEPKVLTLDSQKEKLTPGRIKVKLVGGFFTRPLLQGIVP